MKKPAAGELRHGVAGLREAGFCFLLLVLASAPAWPQELAQDELGTTAGRSFSFQTFQGRDAVIQSAGEIVGIGEVLWRTLRADGTRGSYFGKYEVIRIFDPAQAGLLGADILVFDAGARVNTLDNVQRVVAGYLAAAFGLGQADAARLGVLVTRYNAAHRGDIAYLSGKYTAGVMSHLTAQNAGLALSYQDWPGGTRMVIPLGHAANGKPGVAVTSGQAGGSAAASTAGTTVTPGKAGGTATAGGTVTAGAAGTVGAGGARGAAGGTAAGATTGNSGGSSSGTTSSRTTTSGAGGATSGTTTGAAGSATSGTTTGAAGSAATAAAGTAASPGAASGATETSGTVAAGSPGAGAEATGSPAGSPGTSPGAESAGTTSAQASAVGNGPGALARFLTTGNTRWLILLLLAAVIILAFVVTRLFRAGLSPRWALAVMQSAREGHPLVEMVVTTQNRHIGMRNVHYLRPGSTATIGGGRSTFLVYFVPVPHGMASLTYDGKRYTFVPRDGDLFPTLAGPVSDCLGKPIAAQSTRGYKFTIVFHTYLSPLEETNRLMRSIRVPR